jgi:predicted lipid-binding transport protein (Tim44 family)
MKRIIFCLILGSALVNSHIAECRVGGGRSFGSRGSRGFTAPRSNGNGNSFYRGQPYQQPQSAPQYNYTPPPSAPSTRSTFLKSLGAGVAGGFLGSMIYRGLSGTGNAYSGFGHSSGFGIGPIEILLIGALLFFLYRLLSSRNSAQTTNTTGDSSGAAALMRQARSWKNEEPTYDPSPAGVPIDTEIAMDLFFQIQGAWANRNIQSAEYVLGPDAKSYLEEEIARLKANKWINRLENIAVRNVEVIESWKESSSEFSTVKFTANLLDYTLQEDTQQIIEGSKTQPVKFEEFWTFSKESGSPHWRLSAIQQS